MQKGLGGLYGSKEAKRILSIAPIFICIVGHVADVELLIEEDVDGKRNKVDGHFEFVVKLGNKRVCIVEAKKDDMDQGLVQDLLGLQVLADIHDLKTILGVVTNFQRMDLCEVLCRSCGDAEMEFSVALNAGIPTHYK